MTQRHSLAKTNERSGCRDLRENHNRHVNDRDKLFRGSGLCKLAPIVRSNAPYLSCGKNPPSLDCGPCRSPLLWLGVINTDLTLRDFGYQRGTGPCALSTMYRPSIQRCSSLRLKIQGLGLYITTGMESSGPRFILCPFNGQASLLALPLRLAMVGITIYLTRPTQSEGCSTAPIMNYALWRLHASG